MAAKCNCLFVCLAGEDAGLGIPTCIWLFVCLFDYLCVSVFSVCLSVCLAGMLECWFGDLQKLSWVTPFLVGTGLVSLKESS